MNLQEKYKKEIIIKLKEEFGYKNNMQVPKIEKVVVNVGVGKGLKDSAFIDHVESTLQRISGQQPVKTKAKKSISNFKIREGMVVGIKVNIRGKKMYDFVEKLITITLPRIRDFRGLSLKSVDQKGNLNLGIREHISFPEIKADEIDKLHGLEVSVVTDAKTRQEGISLFKAMGFPFKDK